MTTEEKMEVFGNSEMENDDLISRQGVKDHWVPKNRRPKSWQFICSECGRVVYMPQNHHRSVEKKCGYPHCPYCLAKMEG